MTRTITMMTVSDIMRKATRSLDLGGYGEIDWFGVFANKVSHAHFDNLCDTIANEGFLLPIVLVGTDDDGYTIGNGHHRLCAAILLGLPSIPVIVNDEGDYWAFEDSHDDEWNPGDRSFEYWGMLSGNIPDGYSGDQWNEVHRAQFGNRDDAPCEMCGYESCECCGECDSYPCVCNYCGECESSECRCEYVTPQAIADDEYAYIYCQDCGNWGYRVNHAVCGIDNAIIEAHAINDAMAPPAAWHPEGILRDAYSENDERAARAAQEAAQGAWLDAVNEMREAIRDGAGAWRITQIARRITEANAAYDALQ